MFLLSQACHPLFHSLRHSAAATVTKNCDTCFTPRWFSKLTEQFSRCALRTRHVVA